MGSLFFHLGRRLGYAVIPVIQKSKWAWQSLSSTEAQALEAETKFGEALAAELRLKTELAAILRIFD